MIRGLSICREPLLALTFVGFLGAFTTAGAQGVASLSGRVTDPAGAVLPGVQVTAVHQTTGLQRGAQTDDRGQYALARLTVGVYTVSAQLQGFRTETQEGFTLQVGQGLALNFALELAPVAETITVTAETPLVEMKASEIATNISDVQIENLPVRSRQWLNLATLAPGTGQDAIRGQFYNSVNIGAGVNFYSNGFTVDGVSNNWQQQGEPRQDFPQDGIAEFRLHGSNARAEFGFAQGGYINVVTKSGTNDLHGSAFYYGRNKGLNSKGFFQDEKPEFKRHQYGGSVGGPVVKDKAHFFVSYERTIETSFFTVNTGGVFPEEEGTFERPDFNWMVLVKYDHQLSEKHRLFVRYAQQDNQLSFRGAGGIRARSNSSNFGAPRTSIVFGETWVINDSTLNDFRLQWAKATYVGWPTGQPRDLHITPGFFPEARVNLDPIITRPSLRTGNQSAFLGPERHFQIKNDLAHYFGSHELKVGVDLTWIDWEPDNVGIAENWVFKTDAPFDPNDPSTFPDRFTQRLLPRFDDFPNTEHSLYIDDTWTVTNKLTLNLGLRYDWQTGVWNENLLDTEVPEIKVIDRVVRAAGIQDLALFPLYDSSTRGDGNNLAPRLGFVWDPRGEGRQTIHGAYGVYYNRYRANGAPRSERNPRDLRVVISDPSWPDPYEGQDPFEVAAAQANFTVQGNKNRTPYTHQASLGYTQQVGDDFSVEISGVFANGFNQHTNIDGNYFLTPEDRAAGIRANSEWGRVTTGLTDGKMEYRSLQAKIQRRFADGWQILGSYTLASAKITSESLNDGPADHFDRGAEFGYASSDRRHRLTISGLVELPWGFLTSAILNYRSSLPFDVSAGSDLNKDGLGSDRPPGVTRMQGCRGLNLDAVNSYRLASGRDSVTGIDCPDYYTLDWVLSNRIALGGQYSMELIFQVFNLTNRTNFYGPVDNSLSSSFGQSRRADLARQMELAARFRF